MKKKTRKKTVNYLYPAAIAKQFGFSIKNKNLVSNETIKICKSTKGKKRKLSDDFPPMEELAELTLQYKAGEKESGLTPILTYFDQPSYGTFIKHRKRPGENLVSLHIIGIEDSIADALIIKATQTILEEDGHKKLKLLINNIGGKETQDQFNREATAFFRKNIDLLSANCRQYFKKSVHSLISDGGKQCKILKEGAPVPIDFLDEQSQKNFKDLIEYLENFEIPYEIDHDLLGDENYSSHTIFKIIDVETKKVLAAGTRHDLLIKNLNIRKPIAGISVNIWISKDKKITENQLLKSSPKFFLIQIGNKAKMTSLKLLRTLYKEGLKIDHRIYRDKLSPQLLLAKKIKTDYLITIGHKEALDQTAIIRDSQGKSQKIIPITEVPDYLKKLK